MEIVRRNILRYDRPHIAYSFLIFGFCVVSFLIVPFENYFGKKLFYISGYISLFIFIIHFNFFIQNKSKIILPASILLAGTISVLWVLFYKQQDDYINIYRQYQAAGKVQISAAFIVAVALNTRLPLQKYSTIVTIVTAVTMNAYAFYQSFFLNIDRVALNYDRATIAAYILTLIDLLLMHSLLLSDLRNKITFFLFAFIVTTSALILTGTRSAMIVYPVLVFILVLAIKKTLPRHHKIKLVTLLPVFLILSGLIFNQKITSRINDFRQNIIMMHEQEGENSVISRMSMLIIAVKTGSEALLGQSAGQRGEQARSIAQRHPFLYGALPYTTVHMHNELLETFSIKGIIGVLALLALYISLLFNALVISYNPALLVVTLALIIYGFSDVILFSTEGTIMYCLSIIISLYMMKNSAGTRSIR